MTEHERRGRFIVFEGGEGCGKSTQAERLADRLAALLTRQPGGTELGSQLRSILLDSDLEVMDRTEALLMAADRAQHAEELIRPTLGSGRHVVCDRYTGSSVAYQGHGRGLDPTQIAGLSAWATDDLLPDLVVLLSVDQATAAERTGSPRDRIEAAGSEFHDRVRAGFEAQANADPKRWVVIDGSGTVAEVAAMIDDAVSDRLGL
ncbi:MAG: dTMP kinase [Microthrixaceae bacterium]